MSIDNLVASMLGSPLNPGEISKDVEVRELSSFPPNVNPYRYDHYHMGASICGKVGEVLEVMLGSSPDYLIVVNKVSGKRVFVDLRRFITPG